MIPDREAVSAVRVALWAVEDATWAAPLLPADYYLLTNKAAGRRVTDDLNAGRLQMRWAADLAEWGLEACWAADLARMDLETAHAAGDPGRIDREMAVYNFHLADARECLDAARDLHLLALEEMTSAKVRADLDTSAKLRGRKPKPAIRTKRKAGRPAARDTDLRIEAAVAAQEALRWEGAQAIAAAKRVDPELFAAKTTRQIRDAIRRAKKLTLNPPGKSPT